MHFATITTPSHIVIDGDGRELMTGSAEACELWLESLGFRRFELHATRDGLEVSVVLHKTPHGRRAHILPRPMYEEIR